MLPPSRTKCCHRKVATDAPNVASQMLPATTRRRRDDAEAATAGESLQPPGALTVAAGPRCPHSRCSPPSGLTVVAAHNPQARPAAKQSLQPPKPSQCRCSPQAPSVAAPMRTLTIPGPHSLAGAQVPLTVAAASRTSPSSRCTQVPLTIEAPSQLLPRGCPASSRCSPQVPFTVAAAPQWQPRRRSAAQAVAAAPRCPSQSLQGSGPPTVVAASPGAPHSRRSAQAVTVAAASRARIAVRIEAGRDGDDAATTGR